MAGITIGTRFYTWLRDTWLRAGEIGRDRFGNRAFGEKDGPPGHILARGQRRHGIGDYQPWPPH